MRKTILMCVMVSFVLFLFTSTGFADFKFSIVNKSDKTIVNHLDWIDHNFNCNGPVNMVCAELKPGEEFRIIHTYYPGKYLVSVRVKNTPIRVVTFTVGRNVTSVDVIYSDVGFIINKSIGV